MAKSTTTTKNIKRIFSFDWDDPISFGDLLEVTSVAQAFPKSKFFAHGPSCTSESQVYVFAETPEEAAMLMKDRYPATDTKASEYRPLV